jgi:endoglucanase
MEFLKAKDRIVVNEKGEEIYLKGFGLGGWLLPEGYMWKIKSDRPRKMEQLIEELCGKEYSEYFWKEYRNRYITKEDIKIIASYGYNSVRLPINSRNLFTKVDTEVRFIEDVLQYVDNAIQWCKEYNIYVILDMHGAPGGQTGANIDDSEKDKPELFIENQNKNDLISMWKMLATRYHKEACVAGYDLLNEPLPNWFHEYNDQVLPLYMDITKAIREVDKKHMIILEGVHWDTDFSIFDPMEQGIFDDNLMFQFHKYWNNPDVESIQKFIDYGKRFNIPLFMGEGGENNLDWYIGAFTMLRRANISYSFWSYKKMSNQNSPITFDKPKRWDDLNDYIDGKLSLTKEEGIDIFNEFLQCIASSSINDNVLRVIECQVPITIPAEYYSDYSAVNERQVGAQFRLNDKISILYANDFSRVDNPDYSTANRDKDNTENKLCVKLNENEWTSYNFVVTKDAEYTIKICGKSDNKDVNGAKTNDSSSDISITNENIFNTDEITVSMNDIMEVKETLSNHWEVKEINRIFLNKGNYQIKLLSHGTAYIQNVSIE